MRLFLDTQIYLWFLADSRKLSKAARAVLDQADEVYVSAASIWEAAMKIGTGKLSGSAEDLVAGIPGSGLKELPVRAMHAAAVVRLRDRHRGRRFFDPATPRSPRLYAPQDERL